MVIGMSLIGLLETMVWAGGCEQWKWIWPIPQGNTINEIINDGSEYWLVGDLGLLMRSVDGHEWNIVMSGSMYDFRDIAFAPGDGYMVVGESGVFRTSADGEVWSDQLLILEDLNSVAFHGGSFLAMGAPNLCYTKTGLANPWNVITTTIDSEINDVIYDDDSALFIAVGRNATLAWSPNGGVTWSVMHLAPSSEIELYDVEHIGDLYVIAGEGAVFTSTDLVHWNDVTPSPSFVYDDALYWDQKYWLFGSNVYNSTDGITFFAQCVRRM